MAASYTKLRSGDWGIRVPGRVKAGDLVNVTKKSGEVITETIDRVIWSGSGCSLCSVVRTGSEPSREHGSSRSAVERRYRNRYGWDGVRGSSSYYSSGMYDQES